jgi:oligoendopeptidase F
MLYQLVNTCGTITLASIVDQFEQAVYALPNEIVAEMTVEDFDAIMTEIKSAGEYSGVTSNFIDPCEYWKRVAVSNPVYYVSYSVSAVASLNIYAMALEDVDAAYASYRALVETPGIEEMGYVEALTAAGVASPFEQSSHSKIAKLIDDLLK